MRFAPGPLGTAAKARRAAQQFAELVGEVVNATVSHVPVRFVEVEGGDEFTGFVAHCVGRVPAPMPLENGFFLLLRQALGLRRRERYLTTLEYTYQYQATESRNSWIWRYDYIREPPTGYPYARCHLHVNARPTSYGGAKSFPELHLPVGERVTIEDLVRHMIAEHGLDPVSPNWQQTLEASEATFREIQRKRVRL